MQNHTVKNDDWDNHWQELGDSVFFNTPAILYRWNCLKRLLELDTKNLNDVNLLDVGCGTGEVLEYFLQQYRIIHAKGTDYSAVGLKFAAKKIPQAQFFQADLCNKTLQIPNEHSKWATHATCSEVLEHLDDPITCLKNTGKLLKKGATLVISVPGGPRSKFDDYVGHKKHYTASILKHELEAAGYTVENIYSAGFPFHNLYKLAIIIKGRAIIADAKNHENKNNRLISLFMKCFHFLFKFNLFNSYFGWTVIAKAKWNHD